jgi:hypothetical protein
LCIEHKRPASRKDHKRRDALHQFLWQYVARFAPVRALAIVVFPFNQAEAGRR